MIGRWRQQQTYTNGLWEEHDSIDLRVGSDAEALALNLHVEGPGVSRGQAKQAVDEVNGSHTFISLANITLILLFSIQHHQDQLGNMKAMAKLCLIRT